MSASSPAKNSARRFAVLGSPILHSKSPRMHSAAYRSLGLPHTYEAIDVARGDLPAILQHLRDGTFHGFNVTLPHKNAVLDLVDVVDQTASVPGAANTLTFEDGKIIALNTDVPAIGEELRVLAGANAIGPHAIVLGSGGAARASVVALALDIGCETIEVRARRFSRALEGEEWSHGLKARLRAAGWEGDLITLPLEPAPTDQDASVVVQATSAGMDGADPGDPVAAALEWEALPRDAIALEVIYTPPQTPFLRAARATRHPNANGAAMLVRQGAIAFERWLGVPAPLDVMLAALFATGSILPMSLSIRPPRPSSA
jgi:shikimate dehydrogenase